MKIAIRDDDTSYWTSPAELEAVYAVLWKRKIPISLAVTPFAVQSFNRGDVEKFYQNTIEKEIGKNKQIVEFIKEKLREGLVSIMLHGYSHQYKVAGKGDHSAEIADKVVMDNIRKKQRDDGWHLIGEYNWKDYDRLRHETGIGKEYLQDLFKMKITVFVPPSNDISREGIRAVAANGLNISGSIGLREFNRAFDGYGVHNWLLKLYWKYVRGQMYPYVMRYAAHKELSAVGIVPGSDLKVIERVFRDYKEMKGSCVLATHYWEAMSSVNVREILYHLVNESSGEENAEFVPLGTFFNDDI